ncbi:MAG TPA: hypothetical protein VHT05_11835 [Candidatus Elarobacter sp.]|nr:hypothetical protein [Candidatus Elarobacter sp.]
MAKTRKISVTIDRMTLDEVKRIAGRDSSVSAVLAEALRMHLKRLQMIALIDQWERDDPSSPEQIAAGEKLWQEMHSCSIPVRLPPSRKGTRRSGTRSKKT